MSPPTSEASAPEDIFRSFPSDEYFGHNYKSRMLAEDQEIIGRVGTFFSQVFRGRPPVRRAIDVGSGTNLYPALLMLPWAERILLTDYADTNVAWLHDHVVNEDEDWTWEPFWNELTRLPGYRRISDPRGRLREACGGESGIQRRNIFELPSATEKWQLGTMFFVAESITEERAVFEEAVGCFLGALERGAPFAAAFMAGSTGYPVGQREYPATPVTAEDVGTCLKGISRHLTVTTTKAAPNVRTDYTGMIVATGFADS